MGITYLFAGCEWRAAGPAVQAELQRVPHQQLQQVQRQLRTQGRTACKHLRTILSKNFRN